ncbi:hypothetical protein QDY72_10790 [Kingella negevensis]|uniref:hypothetical protein n=1 Tax=Kingella negevensis TaxID=1522312 RepID=UPI00254E4B89|nr:hypothetical protein [Kingella negevensis]MDK4685631.1 hypothetical protein [Kingella negevensis]MDK4708799.1 hypothetical protein [Kingella negevensis]MDK4711028.1 hypothetical protein [Kingella negevensis]
MFKVNGFILGADSLTKGKEGKPLDLCVLHLLVPSANGFVPYNGFFGVARDTDGINSLVRNNGGNPVAATFDFAFSTFNNQTTFRLMGYLPASVPAAK